MTLLLAETCIVFSTPGRSISSKEAKFVVSIMLTGGFGLAISLLVRLTWLRKLRGQTPWREVNIWMNNHRKRHEVNQPLRMDAIAIPWIRQCLIEDKAYSCTLDSLSVTFLINELRIISFEEVTAIRYLATGMGQTLGVLDGRMPTR